MKKKYYSRLLLVFVFISLLVSGCATALKTDPALVSGTLKNNMRYYILENAEPQNRIFLKLMVNAGSVLEDDDQKGLAHLVEHMAFNGTEHFASNDLIDYLELTGMKFGADVNAYTNFDQTVYMLEIPADKPEVLEKALLILHDWACALSFDPVELEKERGVVIEEWRSGRGVSGRLMDVRTPFLYAGSRYAERLPIGDPEIVKNASRERIMDFYRTWYRPDLMSVVITGAVDTAQIQKLLNQKLGVIASVQKVDGKTAAVKKRPEITIPLAAEKTAEVFIDKEMPVTSVEISQAAPREKITTEQAFRKILIQEMAVMVLSMRLSEKAKEPEAPFVYANCGSYSLSNKVENEYLTLTAKPNHFNASLSAVLEELERIHLFGITESETKRVKDIMLNEAEQIKLNSKKRHSDALAQKIMAAIISGDTFISEKERSRLITVLVPGVTTQELNDAAALFLKSRGTKLFAVANTEEKNIPTAGEILKEWKNWQPPASLHAYKDIDGSKPLFEPLQQSGSIQSVKDASPQGIKTMRLSNKVQVIYYPTTFKDNQIIGCAFSKGGLSRISDKDYPSGAAAIRYAVSSGLNGFAAADLTKKLAGKTLSVIPTIKDNSAGIFVQSSVADFEQMMQVLHLYFTKPYFTQEGWDTSIDYFNTVAEMIEKDVPSQFRLLQAKLLYGDSVRYGAVTKQFVADMNRKKAEEIYRTLFANAADFSFVFVGNIDEKELNRCAEQYLATLPAAARLPEITHVTPAFPKGVVRGNLKKGTAPKSTVSISFGGAARGTEYEEELVQQMLAVLNIRLREKIREDMSGTYGVSVVPSFSYQKTPEFLIHIQFGCEPGREKELTQTVFDEIKRLQTEAVSAEELAKIKELWRRGQETALRQNRSWLSLIVSALDAGSPLSALDATEAVSNAITAENIRKLANRYLNRKNYVYADLTPEK